ncbi:hypothetical protein M3P36_13205 [Altererythrobacter sp. KTW20L]|uniref:hypothetical protein n=1 Tax=Altererythrobacter sp. KTW20L TaxID=2942210 RepID=UPI0020BD4914|nr:hypothetical protein [Altererythrobacter sp. KTW20L]MCL6251998.1 hypothetical protein [Altererythrobacter sp. KTW20L]
MERSNLKDRQADVFAALKQAFDDWNAGMLSDPAASSFGWGPQHLADDYDQPD